jgi:SAM-dependent methyltransferase
MLARQEWPDTVFDGLDLSDSVEDAERRRWIHHGYRGLFPDVAPELAGNYDVVTMSHYLEHTREPRAEIEAAAKVVRPGGAFLVEVPDPESRLGSLLGGFWLPWFQPQHQHFVTVAQLEKMMRESGFEPAVVHRGEAHQVVDFIVGLGLLMNIIAPPPNRPWLKPRGRFAGLRFLVLWLLAIPLLIAARLLDMVLAPLFRRARWSNTYRVLARRV